MEIKATELDAHHLIPGILRVKEAKKTLNYNIHPFLHPFHIQNGWKYSRNVSSSRINHNLAHFQFVLYIKRAHESRGFSELWESFLL